MVLSTVPEPVSDEEALRLLQGQVTGQIPPPFESDQLLVRTGIYMGPVRVTTEVLETRPELVEADWEDIEEYSLRLETGTISLTGFRDEPFLIGRIAAGPVDYRVRIHAKGRDINYDLAVDEPCEDYLIVLWPEPTTGSEAIKLGSDFLKAAFDA
ncbi:hypothetical protein CVV68_01215 [Arthrobacter livingstonensis]|uniref:Uncharacterized protein n=2 Tax=Arthrobacter livingstonensis TaxID=670078 RepID=A0A2V5LE29_9MICC|nr:hypothetical protein CVV68_01215 [Arthrobacter livingstonensis]